jgi:hypothetical protein
MEPFLSDLNSHLKAPPRPMKVTAVRSPLWFVINRLGRYFVLAARRLAFLCLRRRTNSAACANAALN